MRTAVRRGWLNEAQQEDRDALVRRFEEAIGEREAAGYDSPGQFARAAIAQAWTAIELERASQPGFLEALDRALGGPPAAPRPGRPRRRGRVREFSRIDANEIRRRVKADGLDLTALRSIDVLTADKPGNAGERIALAVVPDPRYSGGRVWLVCPGCRRRRRHLYTSALGTRCRDCLSLCYPPAARPG
ncbi:MAG: hypothetical protein IT435_11840 [Phycisphaerales bacterium]|nr:hypothetical protein [Phycisphaerales bacterium]